MRDPSDTISLYNQFNVTTNTHLDGFYQMHLPERIFELTVQQPDSSS